MSSQKEKKKKNGGEICKYLTENRLERTQFWRRVGGVLVLNEVALEQEMKRRAGQRPQLGTVVGYVSGVLHVHPRRNAVGTALLGVNAKERSGITLGMIAHSHVCW